VRLAIYPFQLAEVARNFREHVLYIVLHVKLYCHSVHPSPQDPSETPAATRGETKEERVARKVHVCMHAVGSQDSMSPAKANAGFALTATIFNIPKEHCEPTLSMHMYVW